MVLQKISYYKMLTPERWAEIAAEERHTAQIAAEQKEVPTEEEAPGMEVQPCNFGLEEAEVEFQHARAAEAAAQFEAEQAAILDSIQSKREVVANRHCIHLTYVRRERLFVDLDDEEEESELGDDSPRRR
jgi:hypothetical protein